MDLGPGLDQGLCPLLGNPRAADVVRHLGIRELCITRVPVEDFQAEIDTCICRRGVGLMQIGRQICPGTTRLPHAPISSDQLLSSSILGILPRYLGSTDFAI